MYLKMIDGPMDGAEYALSKLRDEPSTNRKPDGVWFDAIDDKGRNVQHQYAFEMLEQMGDDVCQCYRYSGPVVDTGIEMETTAVGRPTHPDEVASPIREAISSVMNKGKIHGCHDCGEERPAVQVDFTLVCPECHSKNITCIEK